MAPHSPIATRPVKGRWAGCRLDLMKKLGNMYCVVCLAGWWLAHGREGVSLAAEQRYFSQRCFPRELHPEGLRTRPRKSPPDFQCCSSHPQILTYWYMSRKGLLERHKVFVCGCASWCNTSTPTNTSCTNQTDGNTIKWNCRYSGQQDGQNQRQNALIGLLSL